VRDWRQIDSEKKEAHVEGGILLSALNKALDEQGLALSNLGSISDQTLAGTISTATHGTGVKYGPLSSFVTFLDIVLPQPCAPLVRVSREEDEELFLAALCGLGVVGIIVGVGLQVEEKFKLEEEHWTMRIEEFIKHWQVIAESGEHVRAYWFPQLGEVKVDRMNRTSKVSPISWDFRSVRN
jgi:hypothetical protein